MSTRRSLFEHDDSNSSDDDDFQPLSGEETDSYGSGSASEEESESEREGNDRSVSRTM